MNPAGLTAKLGFDGLVFDLLQASPQVAQTARCEEYSRSLQSLEDAEGSEPEREKQADPPPAIRA